MAATWGASHTGSPKLPAFLPTDYKFEGSYIQPPTFENSLKLTKLRKALYYDHWFIIKDRTQEKQGCWGVGARASLPSPRPQHLVSLTWNPFSPHCLGAFTEAPLKGMTSSATGD